MTNLKTINVEIDTWKNLQVEKLKNSDKTLNETITRLVRGSENGTEDL